jgi:serine/threonine protein kinase
MQANFSRFESKYQKVETDDIGHGAQGSVFKVVRKDDPNGEVFAAKIYHMKDGGHQETIYKTEVLMYRVLPKTDLFGKMVEHFDEGDKKILILKLIDGHTYKYHKDELPVDTKVKTDIALKQAIQMTKMLMSLEGMDLYYADFHGENLMVKKSGDLVLTDFGASARIMDRTGAINPKGFCANQILEKYNEKKQTPAEFRERLYNEHNSKQLLNQFKSIARCVEDTADEYMSAFKGLNKFIEQALRDMVEQDATESYQDPFDKLAGEVQEKYDYANNSTAGNSTLDSYYGYGTYGTYGGSSLLKATNSVKNLSGPSMCEKIMEKLRYIVFNKQELLRMTFEDEQEYQKYYDARFLFDEEEEAQKKKLHIALHSDF